MAKSFQRPGLVKRLNRLFGRYSIDVRHKLAGSTIDVRPSPSMLGEDFGYLLKQSWTQALNNNGTFDKTARYCLSGDTKVATPSAKGYETIEDLCKLYPNGEKFYVFAYDKENDEVKCVEAEFPHYTKTSEVVKLITDHGDLTCTPDHRIMLRDGSYKEAQYLVEGEALMPFYRKMFKGERGYRHIYGFSRNKKTGEYGDIKTNYVPEYMIVRESVDVKRYGRGTGMHIHHKDFNKSNDLPENLEPMTQQEHTRLHVEVINGKRWAKPEEHEKMSKFMKEFANSEKGKIIRENARKTEKYFESHSKVCKERNSKSIGFDGLNARTDLTIEHILSQYEFGMSTVQMSKKLNCGINTLKSHISWHGHKDWESFITFAGYYKNLMDKILSNLNNETTANELCYKTNMPISLITKVIRKNGYKSFGDLRENFGFKVRSRKIQLKDLEKIYLPGMLLKDLAEKIGIDRNIVTKTLQRNGYKNYYEFEISKGSTFERRVGGNNPNYDKNFTFQDICNAFQKGMTEKELVKKLDKNIPLVQRRIKDSGYEDYNDFSNRYENCKVIRVEKIEGEIPVYDMTVPSFHNFAVLNQEGKSLIFLSNSDYEEMDTGEIGTALDIYSQESATYFEDGQILHITSPNKHIEQILNSLFYDILNIEFNAHFWLRNLCKYGDFFLLLDLNEQNGIVNAIPVPVSDIERMEGMDDKDPFKVEFRWLGAGNLKLEPWKVIHMRLMGKHRFLPYGTSKIDNARRIFRQISLLEDAILLYRMVRSPARRAFYVDVQGLKPDQVEHFMRDYISKIRHQQLVSSDGSIEKRLNPLDVTEDYFIPVRGSDSGTRIETIEGQSWGTDMEDINYIHDKLLSSLGIPRAYLQYQEALTTKGFLSVEDVRFARSVQQIQKAFVSELSRIAIIHLYVMGYDGSQLVDFDISLNSPSAIYEVQKLDLWRTRMEIAQMIPEAYKLPKQFVYDTIYKLSESETNTFKEQFMQESIDNNEIETAAGSSGAEGGGMSTQPKPGGGSEMPPLTPTDTGVPMPENNVSKIDMTPQSDVIHDAKNIESTLIERVKKYDQFTENILKELKNSGKVKKLLND